MEAYITAIKDILIIATPIIVAYLSYKSNKQSQKDIKLEVEKVSKAKEAETKQILEKITAEQESQKHLLSWQNSLPQTNEYTSLIDKKRFGHISALPQLCQSINLLLSITPSLDELIELTKMLDRIDLPDDTAELFPHEVTILLNFKIARKNIATRINELLATQTAEQQEESPNADA